MVIEGGYSAIVSKGCFMSCDFIISGHKHYWSDPINASTGGRYFQYGALLPQPAAPAAPVAPAAPAQSEPPAVPTPPA